MPFHTCILAHFNMLSSLLPDEEINSVYEIDFAKLKAQGKRGIIFDLDNTLGEWGFTKLDERVWQLLDMLKKEGFVLGFLSNDSPKSNDFRLSTFRLLGCFGPMVFHARKPLSAGYEKLLAQMNVKVKEAVMVGDQLFTDIFGAKRLKIYSILVEPVDRSKESFFTRVRRALERALLSLLAFLRGDK